jgi:hypothetical protein
VILIFFLNIFNGNIVLGDTQSAHNLQEDLLIIGRCGILLVTENEEEYMPMLLQYLSLMSRRFTD